MSEAIIFEILQNLIGLYFRNIFPIGGLVLLWSSGFTIFQSMIP